MLENNINHRTDTKPKRKVGRPRKSDNLITELNETKEIKIEKVDKDELQNNEKETQYIKKKRFRFRGISVFLTYSQVDVKLEDFMNSFLKLPCFGDRFGQIEIDQHLFSTELHKDGGTHFHGFVKFKETADTSDFRIFDCLGFHPNMETPKNQKKVIKYILKEMSPQSITEDNYKSSSDYEYWLSFIKTTEEDKPNKTVSKEVVKTELRKIYNTVQNTGNVNLALNQIAEIAPDIMLTKLSSIKNTVDHFASKHIDFTLLHPFFKFDLHGYYDVIEWVLRDYKTHTLVLCGASNTGKTALARLLLGDYPFTVNQIQGFRLFKPNHHTGILFDDFDFPDNESTIRALIDPMSVNDIRIAYGSISIPPLPKIICTNYDLRLMFTHSTPILRRLKIVHISTSLRFEADNYLFKVPKQTTDKVEALILSEKPEFNVKYLALNTFLRIAKIKVAFDDLKSLIPNLDNSTILDLKCLDLKLRRIRSLLNMENLFPENKIPLEISSNPIFTNQKHFLYEIMIKYMKDNPQTTKKLLLEHYAFIDQIYEQYYPKRDFSYTPIYRFETKIPY